MPSGDTQDAQKSTRFNLKDLSFGQPVSSNLQLNVHVHPKAGQKDMRSALLPLKKYTFGPRTSNETKFSVS